MMSRFLYSEKQSNVLSNFGKIINIAYDDISVAIQTVAFATMQELLRHKACLIVVPNENHRKQLINRLTDIGMSSSVFECNPNTIVCSDETEAIRSMLELQNHLLKQPDKELAKFLFQQQKKEIILYYTLLNQVVFKQKTWKDLLQDYLALKPNNSVLILHKEIDITDFTFDAAEFDNMKLCLSDALLYYQRDFEITDAVMYKINLKIDLFIIDKLQEVTHDLFTFKEQASKLRDEYFVCLHNLQNSHLYQDKLWVKNTSNALDLIAFRVEKLIINPENKIIPKGIFIALKPKSSTSNIEYANICSDLEIILKNLRDKKIVTDVSLSITLENIGEVISKLQLNIKAWDAKATDRTTSYIKSVNKLNIQDSRLLELELCLSNLLRNINGSKIFETGFELNTLSFIKQVDFISQLVHDIENMILSIDRNMPYYQWLSFLVAQDDKCKNIISALKKFDPNEWLLLFELWYYFEILNKYKMPSDGKDLMESTFDVCSQHFDCWQEKNIETLTQFKYNNHQTAISALKVQNAAFYQSIVKKQKLKEKTFWKHLIENNIDFFSKLFPILVVNEDDFDHLEAGHYQTLFYLSPNHINANILQNFETIHTYISEQNITKEKIDLSISDVYFAQDKTIAEIPMSYRLSIIKKIASSMLSFSVKPTIYHLRNSSIISYSNDFFNRAIEDYLYDCGIKKILLDNSVFDTLIATLLDVSKPSFVVIEDYLLNASSVDDFLLQRKLILEIESSGSKIINVDNMAIMLKLWPEINKMFNLLKSANTINNKADQKNQILLEFSK